MKSRPRMSEADTPDSPFPHSRPGRADRHALRCAPHGSGDRFIGAGAYVRGWPAMVVTVLVALVLAIASAHADNERFDASELARDAPQYFVLLPEDPQTTDGTGELRLSENGIDLTNGELLDVMLEQGNGGGHLVYKVDYGQNPIMPSGGVCAHRRSIRCIWTSAPCPISPTAIR